MKTALDFYARGKQKEANADEYDRFRYYSRDRFICPECGEAVHLTGSKYSNHFAHFKKNDVSAESIVVFEGDAIIEILNEQNESIIQIAHGGL